MWEAATYLRFGDERSRPFVELVARVAAEAPGLVVDLGCGPGNLTALLARRWPEAEVVGVDSSADMVAAASAHAGTRLRFVHADLADWEPDRPADVVVANAALQWVPGHLGLLGRLVERVSSGGWLAFQVPGNFDAPSHRSIAEQVASPHWRDRVDPATLERSRSHEPAEYLAALLAAGCEADVWETTYLHLLGGEDPVLRWVEGTALRPVLAALDDEGATAFREELARRLRSAYPPGPHGTIFPFRRIFAVARTPAPAPRRG